MKGKITECTCYDEDTQLSYPLIEDENCPMHGGKMQITVEKITDKGLCDWACSITQRKEIIVKDMRRMYVAEHSPIRTQMFKVTARNIPSFVAQHFRTHCIGNLFFISTSRDDLTGVSHENSNRNSPVDMGIVMNAHSLIHMAKERLCFNAHAETIKVMKMIHTELHKVDVDLSLQLMPKCEYRKMCPEFKSCGYWENKVDKLRER